MLTLSWLSLLSNVFQQALDFNKPFSAEFKLWSSVKTLSVCSKNNTNDNLSNRPIINTVSTLKKIDSKTDLNFFFQVEGRDIPIVHRVLKVHEQEDGSIKFLTKGDNNSVDDRGLYAPGQNWLAKKDVVGRARGFLPYVGIVTILMNEYPKFKYCVLACLGVYVLIHRE